jgi:hypothetical protein
VEVAPTEAVAATRTEAALMEEAARTVRAVAEDILVPAGQTEAALTSVAGAVEDSGADSAEADRRDIRQRRGRAGARTGARRHASRAAIPQVRTAEGVTGARAEVMGAHTAARVVLVMGTALTEVPGMETLAERVARLTAEIADLTAARDKAGRTTMRTARTLTGIRLPGAAATGRRRIVIRE